MKKVVFVLLIIVFSMLHGNVYADDDAVLAKVGDKTITVADFGRFIDSFPPDKQKFLMDNPQNRETVLVRLAQVLALADIAKKQGLDKDARISRQIEYYTSEILAQELIKQEIKKIQVTDEEAKSYYSINEKAFKTPEMVRARHILIKVEKSATDEEKKKAREKAEDILKKIRAGEDFAKLAAEVSDDPGSKGKGGDLGFFGKGRMIKPFEEAAFSLKPGEVSGIVETNFGFHIIKVEEKKEAGVEPFETAKEKARAKLLEEMAKERAKNFIDTAMKNAGVEIHHELLTGGKK